MHELIELRNRHLRGAIRREYENVKPGERADLATIAWRAASGPAPTYYCTYEYALRMLRVLRHGRLKLRRDRRLMLWLELNERTTALMERHGISLPDALARVLADGHASQFFISPSRAATLASEILKQK